MLQAAEAGKEALLELVLPPTCRLCNQPIASSDDFCRPCLQSLTLSEATMRAACPRCGHPRQRVASNQVAGNPNGKPSAETSEREENAGSQAVVSSSPSAVSGRSSCPHCRQLEFCFDGVIVLWAYQGRVCEAVVAAKYAHQTPLGDALGRRLAARVQSMIADDLPDWVTYIPSHLTRQISRGGNGNQVMAAAVARAVGRPCRRRLRTTRRIDKQAWLDDAQRIENVRGAFSLRKSYASARSPELANRHILLVDDVLTTGATANEVARVLRDGGARRVSLAVIARAIRSS